MDVTVGESVVLPCQVQHDPILDISFTWYFNGTLTDFKKDASHFEKVGGVSCKHLLFICLIDVCSTDRLTFFFFQHGKNRMLLLFWACKIFFYVGGRLFIELACCPLLAHCSDALWFRSEVLEVCTSVSTSVPTCFSPRSHETQQWQIKELGADFVGFSLKLNKTIPSFLIFPALASLAYPSTFCLSISSLNISYARCRDAAGVGMMTLMFFRI